MINMSCLIHVIMVLAHIAIDNTFTHESILDYVCRQAARRFNISCIDDCSALQCAS
jgi:hypothetical protein